MTSLYGTFAAMRSAMRADDHRVGLTLQTCSACRILTYVDANVGEFLVQLPIHLQRTVFFQTSSFDSVGCFSFFLFLQVDVMVIRRHLVARLV